MSRPSDSRSDAAELWSARGEGTGLVFADRRHTRRVFICTATVVAPLETRVTELQLLPPYRRFMLDFFKSLPSLKMPTPPRSWASEYEELLIQAQVGNSGDIELFIDLPGDEGDIPTRLTVDSQRMLMFTNSLERFLRISENRVLGRPSKHT